MPIEKFFCSNADLLRDFQIDVRQEFVDSRVENQFVSER